MSKLKQGPKGQSKILKISSPLYYCTHCKKIIPFVEALLFVEEGSPRGFCTERCIEKYYAPMVEHFQKIETELRLHNGLEHEECLKLVHSPSHIEACMQTPGEIWRLENELKEEIFTFIFHTNDKNNSSIILLCTVFDYRPSFIFLLTATSNANLLKEFQIGEKVADVATFISSSQGAAQTGGVENGPSDALDFIRSNLLAELVERHTKADIPIESYVLYEDLLEESMNNPDEVCQFTGPHGEELIVHIKAHEKGGISFYYYVICVGGIFLKKILPKQQIDENQVIPLLAFPSLNGEVYKYYKRGKQILGGLKN